MKDEKALSRSVVMLAVAIILTTAIAVALAVLWPASPPEQMQIYASPYANVTGRYIVITFDNTGSVPIVVNEVWINGVKMSNVIYDPSETAPPGSSAVITISYNWTSGVYNIKLVSSRSKGFSYQFIVG